MESSLSLIGLCMNAKFHESLDDSGGMTIRLGGVVNLYFAGMFKRNRIE
ncbi:hypothetical protein B398_11720 [Xylella fastidiosa 32]|nr:hypothetical protein B398_11720 [Xylella fastidiosa 32]